MIKNYLTVLDSFFFMDGEADHHDKKSFYTIAITVNVVSVLMFLYVLLKIMN